MGDRKNNSGTWTAATRELYEGKVGVEAVARAGRNLNLKDIIHEVLAKDAANTNLMNRLAGKRWDGHSPCCQHGHGSSVGSRRSRIRSSCGCGLRGQEPLDSLFD